MRHFIRFYLLKILFVLIVVEIGILVYFQKRNHKPVAQPDEVSSYSGKFVKVSALRNDTDEDEDSIFISGISDVNFAKAEIVKNKLHVQIKKDFVGTDSITYTISDGKKTSSSIVKFEIKENKPPIGKKDCIVIYSWDKSTAIYAQQNDWDKERDSIFIQTFTQPKHGKVELKDRFIYTPKNNFIGIDSFHYVLSDNISLSDKIAVIVERKQIIAVKTKLNYHYYEGEWNVLPEFNKLAPLKSGLISNINNKVRMKEENYGIKFFGFIQVPKSDTYTFYLGSDDGSALYIESQKIIDNDGLHGFDEEEGKVYLTNNKKYPIEVQFFQRGGGHSVTLKYRNENGEKVPVPNSWLYHVITK